VTLFGVNFGPGGSAAVQNGKFPSVINGTSVMFDGYSAPLVFANNTQVNAIVPYEIAGQASTTITVQGGGKSGTATVPVVQAVPALFTSNGSGIDQAAALNQDFTVNSPSSPANPGDVIVLYGTGAGLVNSSPADGTISGSSAATPNLPITVTIGGTPAQILYGADAPGLVSGVIQINAVIPKGIGYSHHVPVKWSAGSFTSPDGVTIAVNDTPAQLTPITVSSDDLSKTAITVSPTHIPADTTSSKITIVGADFATGMVVRWNGVAMPTQFIDSIHLQAVVAAASLELAGIGTVSVWDAGGTTQITQTASVIVYVPLLNHDIVYDAMRNKIYVAVAASQQPQRSSIAILNPETQRVENTIPLPAEPTKLAISDDDHYLYAATGTVVQRIDLNSSTVDLTVNIGTSVTSMRVLPGLNTALAVVASSQLFVFDGAQRRANTTGNFNGPSFLIGGPDVTTLYGGDSIGNLYTLSITPAGISVVGTAAGLLGADGDPVFAGGLIYDGWGAVVDPAIPAVTATFDNQGLILPFPDLGKVLILGGAPPPGSTILTAPPVLTLHDISGGARFWSLPIPAQTTLNHGPIIRWEQNGIALREPGSYASDPAFGLDLFRINIGN
jgi:uncharacterized protein (TIGR03437 family)